MQCLRRPLWYAIVDEADAQLIDNSANPFIIATPSGVQSKAITDREAARIAVADTVRVCTAPSSLAVGWLCLHATPA